MDEKPGALSTLAVIAGAVVPELVAWFVVEAVLTVAAIARWVYGGISGVALIRTRLASARRH